MADPQIVVRGTSDFRSLNADIARTEGRFSSFGRNMGRAVLAGTVVAGYGIARLGIASSRAASQSEQSLGATRSVFGKYADEVIRRSGQAANAVGLSANEYRELSNVTGAMLASAGTPLRKVAGLTGDLNKRAADMAATFGGPTSQAVEAISSLLRGETDPIERYGVSIKASDISARLAAKGLDKLTGSALKQAEQQERLALLFEQTGSSQGAFRRESGTLANQQQKLGAGMENLRATLGTGLNPALTAGARLMNRELLPPIQRLAEKYVPAAGAAFGEWIENIDFGAVAGDTRDFVEGIDWDSLTSSLGDITKIAREAGPALGEELADGARVGGTLLSFLADHTDELAQAMPYLVAGLVAYKAAQVANNVVGRNSLVGFGLQLTATFSQAAANRQLAVSLREVNAAQATANGGIGATTSKLSRMQVAVRGAAGIGGLGLLAHGAQQSNDKLGLLESTAGGALTGFAVAGPWGAAVGAGAGALLGLATQTDDTAKRIHAAVPKVDSMTDALDQMTGALQDNAAEQALSNLRTQLQKLVDLTVGESNFGKMQKEFGNFANDIESLPDGSTIESLGRTFGLSARTITNASLGQRNAIRAVNQAFRGADRSNYDHIIAMRALRNIIGPVNRELRKNQAEVRRNALVTQDWSGKLRNFPDKAATRIDLRGVKPTETAIARLTLKYRGIDNKNIKTILGVTGVDATVEDIRKAARELQQADRKEARMKTSIAGAASVRSEVERTRTVLDNLDGDAAHTWIYTHRVTTYETRGDPGGRGPGRMIPAPLDRLEPAVDYLGRVVAAKAEKAGEGIIARLLRGITGGSAGVKESLGKLTDYIEKRINLEDPKKERERERAVLKHLSDEYAALKRNGQAQDEINRKLAKAREHLAEVRAYVDQIKQGFVDTGDIVQLGQLEDGGVSGVKLLDDLRQRVAQAEQFAALIRDLTDSNGVKINQTTLQQLLTAGPQAGLAAAQALVTGGDAALQEINSLTAQLAASGQSLGAQMSNQFFDVGLQASIGLVNGLAAQDRALDRAAKRLGRKLAEAVRKALGISSPSREFRDIGLQTIRGLSLGLDETFVASKGRRVAASLVDGFSTPQLAASVTGGGAGDARLVSVRLTAEQTSQLQRGKAVTLDIDAGQARGVRRIAVAGR